MRRPEAPNVLVLTSISLFRFRSQTRSPTTTSGQPALTAPTRECMSAFHLATGLFTVSYIHVLAQNGALSLLLRSHTWFCLLAFFCVRIPAPCRGHGKLVYLS